MKVFLLRGLPGAGKSTVSLEIAMQVGSNRMVVVSSDHFFIGPDGAYRHDRTKLGEAHAQCFRKYLGYLARDVVDYLVVDNTNTHPMELAPYVLAAGAYHHPVRILEVVTDPATSVVRNTHGCPQDVILNMADNLLLPLPPFWPAAERYTSANGQILSLNGVPLCVT